MKKPLISICVCCFNAASRIEETLYSLICQTAELQSYEIIIIDNGSDDIDKLKDLIGKTDFRNVSIRLIIETHVGLSYARNRAVDESRGEYVFFIDDDAIANARLVELYIHSIKDFNPDVFGGNVIPFFEKQPPMEIDCSKWSGLWSIKYFGDKSRWLEEGEYFIGTNIGAKRSLLLKNRFDSELGRKNELLIGGEEWFLGESQFKRLFVAGAYVFHKIPGNRMTIDYIAKRSFYAKSQMGQAINSLWVIAGLLKKISEEFFLSLKRVIFWVDLRFRVYRLKRNGSRK